MSDNKILKTNYIFIDFENVQPSTIDISNNYPFKIVIFVGKNQTKIPIELVTSIQKLGDRAEYVLINGNGKNALDFHITYYLGKLCEKDPNGYYHIISKDKGFDILIEHLKEKKIAVYRHCNVNDIPFVKRSTFESLPINEQIITINDYLIQRGNAKPRRVETLSNTIMSLSGRTLSEGKISNIVNILAQKKLITIKDKTVTYKLKNNAF